MLYNKKRYYNRYSNKYEYIYEDNNNNRKNYVNRYNVNFNKINNNNDNQTNIFSTIKTEDNILNKNKEKTKFYEELSNYIKSEDINLLLNICTKNPNIPSELKENGNTILHDALILKKNNLFDSIINVFVNFKNEGKKEKLDLSVKNINGDTYINIILFNMLDELKQNIQVDLKYLFLSNIEIIDYYFNMINKLMEMGASIYESNNIGETPLELIYRINISYYDDDNLLISLIKLHKWKSAKLLLKIGGFDINYQNKYGNTALHILTNIINNIYHFGDYQDMELFELVVELLKCGANDKVKNQLNKYPYILI
jgi:hypothetical protein